MNSRNKKYTKSKNNSNTIAINLDIVALQLICNFVVSSNKNIHKSNIMNLRSLFNKLDMTRYENDQEKLNKIDFIKKGIEARIDYNLTKRENILMHIGGGIIQDTELETFDEVNNDEVNWINKIVVDALDYGHMYSEVANMKKICEDFELADNSMKKKYVEEFKNKVNEINTKFRHTEANSSSELFFSLQDGVLDECIRTVHDKVTSPSNTLITGFTGINELLGGGFESTRVYSLFGLPSEGKSITLLDFAIQIKKYNPGYICKDPTKKPCVVYFTLENAIEETVVRLCEMTGMQGSMGDYTVDEIVDKIRTDGELYVNSASPMDLIIIYQPGMSVDTSYLYTMTENLEERGYETVAVIIDYIKRIRSTLDNSDTRIWLGNVINEFKVFASTKDLVVITASQLNRDATSHIDESRKANKSDLVRMLGRSQIGESMLILENLDGAFIIAPEWTPENKKYLGFQRIKKRYKASDLTHLYYPYENEIKLMEDLNALEPVYKTTMKDTPTNLSSLTNINQVQDIGEVSLKKSDTGNIFLSGAMSVIDDSNDYICPVKRI